MESLQSDCYGNDGGHYGGRSIGLTLRAKSIRWPPRSWVPWGSFVLGSRWSLAPRGPEDCGGRRSLGTRQEGPPRFPLGSPGGVAGQEFTAIFLRQKVAAACFSLSPVRARRGQHAARCAVRGVLEARKSLALFSVEKFRWPVPPGSVPTPSQRCRDFRAPHTPWREIAPRPQAVAAQLCTVSHLGSSGIAVNGAPRFEVPR